MERQAALQTPYARILALDLKKTLFKFINLSISQLLRSWIELEIHHYFIPLQPSLEMPNCGCIQKPLAQRG